MDRPHQPPASALDGFSRRTLRRIRWTSIGGGVIAALVLCALVLSALAASKQRNFLEQRNRLLADLSAQLIAYHAVASSFRALFDSSEQVTEAEFSRFADAMLPDLQLSEDSPVIYAAFAPRIADDELAAFTAQLRQRDAALAIEPQAIADRNAANPDAHYRFPVLFMSPRTPELDRVLGNDLLQLRPDAVTAALAADWSLTRPQQSDGTDATVLLQVLPVYRRADTAAPTADSLVGLLALSVPLKPLIESGGYLSSDSALAIAMPGQTPLELLIPSRREPTLLERPIWRFEPYVVQRTLEIGGLAVRLQVASTLTLPVRDLIWLALSVAVVVLLTITLYARQRAQLLASVAAGASRAKNDFLATMSHEIRTPLNGVLGMAELLAQTPLNAQQRSYTDTIRSAGNQLLEIINDILDLSKIESDRMALEAVGFDLAQLTSEIADIYRVPLYQRGVHFSASIAPGTPTQLIGDPTRLRQVLTNLLGNAAKFTSSGDISLRVNAMPGSGNRLRFVVRDSGIGIPRDQQQAIFDAFTQATGDTARRYGGTGLGLKICKDLVEMMGGSIGVDSTPGHGSRFWFEIPLPVAAAVDEPASALADDLLPSRALVLVVDDYLPARQILLEQLRALDLRAEAVENTRQAWSWLVEHEATPPDLIISDFNMPGESGAEFAVRLADDNRFRTVPMMVLSASGLPPADLTTLPNVRLVSTKPTATSQLQRQLQLALQHNGNGSGATVTPLLQPLNVLVAEDNPVNARVLKGMLEQLGHRPLLCGDGAAALAAYRRAPQRIDLILMDYEMPVLDGLEATRRIRQLESEQKLPRKPIIALTAHAFREQQEKCLAAGMDGYLSKPISLNQLGDTLREYQHQLQQLAALRGITPT